jgi:hypothetical protein
LRLATRAIPLLRARARRCDNAVADSSCIESWQQTCSKQRIRRATCWLADLGRKSFTIPSPASAVVAGQHGMACRLLCCCNCYVPAQRAAAQSKSSRQNLRVQLAADVAPGAGVVTPVSQGVQLSSGPTQLFHWPCGQSPTMVGKRMYEPAGTTAGKQSAQVCVRLSAVLAVCEAVHVEAYIRQIERVVCSKQSAGQTAQAYIAAPLIMPCACEDMQNAARVLTTCRYVCAPCQAVCRVTNRTRPARALPPHALVVRVHWAW